MSTEAHTSTGFIYWLLREQHCKRSGCTRDKQRGERGERAKGQKVWGEKSGTESTEIVQLCCMYMWGDLMFLLLRTYFHFQPFPAILQTQMAIWNLVPLQSIVLGIQSQDHVLHFHIHLQHEQLSSSSRPLSPGGDGVEKVLGTW